MAAKRMLAIRVEPALADLIDERARAAGVTRTELVQRTLARAFVSSSGRPQHVEPAVEIRPPRQP